jgi:glycosyltransferase involved in cell wall biosynthesis
MLSIAIATYNEEKKIERTLKSVSGWADEIMIVDGHSTDKTVEIAKKYTDKIFFKENELMFHKNKNEAIEKCTGDWIFFLDADEVLSGQMKMEIDDVLDRRERSTGMSSSYAGFDMPRANFFLGRFLKKGGQYPDTRVRLFRKGKGEWPCLSVHEQLRVNGNVGHLKNDLLHYSYESMGEYWKKAMTYTKLTAESIKKEKTNIFVKFFKYCVSLPIYTFFNIYLRHRGYVDSWQGLLFAKFSALHFPIAFFRSL